MNLTRTRNLSTIVAALAGFLLIACGGGNGNSAAPDAFFILANADQSAHAALVDAADLPGGGWEVTVRGAIEDDDTDSDSDSDFDAVAQQEPACDQLVGIGNLGGIFGGSGGDDDGERVARAQIEIERATDEALIPTSVEVEIEVESTVAEVQGSWALVKGLLESDRTEECIANVVNTLFGVEMAESGIEVTLEPRDSLGSTPQDGASMAFLMSLTLEDVISLDVIMEMHLWPYGNAKVTVLLLGTENELTAGLVRELLAAVDQKIVVAERTQ